ncbi:hypothetical protein [Vibrio vulnificus]|uniref:hypothetical protein n=1 Tax=Vibrio vulnificus TaxID=672 RepID=UPI0028FCBFE8|nr:hypothetical protein [Vibrio vulnificus]
MSASRLQWALFSGHLFFGAKNSENCLNQFSGKREVWAKLQTRFAKIPSLIIKTMIHFGFLRFGFCV